MFTCTPALRHFAMASAGNESTLPNRIQVSQSKRPLFFYVNLAKRILATHGAVSVSALGLAISTAVTVAEILKNGGFAVEKGVETSTMDVTSGVSASPHKAKITVDLAKSSQFDRIMAEEGGQGQ